MCEVESSPPPHMEEFNGRRIEEERNEGRVNTWREEGRGVEREGTGEEGKRAE